MKWAFFGGAAVLVFAVPALAADVEPAPEPAGGLFGYISGGYYFEDAIQDWRLFDLGAAPASKESFDDGWGIQGRLGYRWDEWDIAVSAQYADFGAGDVSEQPLSPWLRDRRSTC